MKKNPKFRIFSTFYLSNILCFISGLIFLSSVFFVAGTLISENLSAQLISEAISLCTKTRQNSPSAMTQTLLQFSMPSVSLETYKETFEEVVPVEQETESTPQEIPIQSITYESAAMEGYTSIEGIYINNQSGKTVNMESLLNKELDISLSTQSPSVLIVHTHTSESYTPSEMYNYTPTDTDRTQDENYNMIAVGEILYQKLKEKGINVIHDKTINDYPSYSSSYSKSLKLVQSYTEKYPSIKIVIDVHRDAIVSKNGTKVRPITNFDSQSSQVMLVVGTNGSGLNHSSWETNLSFALKLQHEMNSLYPSLARPINLRKERFNQHTAPYAFILEVGSNGNTLEEAKTAAAYFSDSLLSLLKV